MSYNSVFRERRKARSEFDVVDSIIERAEDEYRFTAPASPLRMEASKQDLEITPTAEITVSSKWLAALLQSERHLGEIRIIEILDDLFVYMDNWNEREKDHMRDAFPSLYEILENIKEQV